MYIYFSSADVKLCIYSLPNRRSESLMVQNTINHKNFSAVVYCTSYDIFVHSSTADTFIRHSLEVFSPIICKIITLLTTAVLVHNYIFSVGMHCVFILLHTSPLPRTQCMYLVMAIRSVDHQYTFCRFD